MEKLLIGVAFKTIVAIATVLVGVSLLNLLTIYFDVDSEMAILIILLFNIVMWCVKVEFKSDDL